jgi:hypothetical protein
VEGSILGRRKIKKMKSLEEHMMTSSGSQNFHLHPDASAAHRDEITHFADVSRFVCFLFSIWRYVILKRTANIPDNKFCGSRGLKKKQFFLFFFFVL